MGSMADMQQDSGIPVDPPWRDPNWGWCHCGMAIEDPSHNLWHKLLSWNRSVFARGQEETQKEFDKQLEYYNKINRKETIIEPQQTIL